MASWKPYKNFRSVVEFVCVGAVFEKLYLKDLGEPTSPKRLGLPSYREKS